VSDLVVVIVVVVGFASLVTAHVTLVVGLLGRPPRTRALFALFVPPLALYWGVRERMYVRAVVWLVAACAYGVALVLATRGT
jgi:hypothetical protein